MSLIDEIREKLARKSAMTEETQELLNNVKIANKNKIVRTIAGLVLAGAMALAAIGLAACSADCKNVTTTGQQQPGGTNPGGLNPGGNNDDETTEFSDILSNILTEENRNLWQKVYDNGFRISNDVKPIPYKFLRENGHNVDAYLDGTLDVFASSYIYDNDKNHIYVSVKAENVSSSQYGNYYTNYVLKYPLTNQEYEEYTYLCEGEYVQGLYYIQELANLRNPKVQSKVNIAIYSYNDMIKEFTKWDNVNVNKYNKIDIDIIGFNENEITITSRGTTYSNYFKNTIGTVRITPTRYTGIDNYEGNVHYLADAYRVKFNYDDEYKASLRNITSFSYGTQIGHTNPYNYYEVKNK